MALTNFASLTGEQYTIWSRDFWKEARNKTFIMSFAGSSSNSMVHRISELRDTKDGARAVITLVNDAIGDGVVGDNTLKGNEEALRSTDDVIRLDQWRQAHRSQGRMAEQKSIVNFRMEAKDKLSYTVSRVMDELAFLTMSGISYAFKTDGSPRVGSQLPLLEYAADVTPPTSKRYCRWVGPVGATPGYLVTSGATNTTMVETDTPSWAMLVNLKAFAVNSYLRPVRADDGTEVYYVFMSPSSIAKLKQESAFLTAWQHAQKRGDENPLFKGTKHGGKQGIYIDGMHILEYRNVFTTQGAAPGSKWGAGGLVDGTRVLLCGAQALAFADIGSPRWVEDDEDYENQQAISVGKIFGLLKPQLFSRHANSVQDFGVIACDVAL